MADVYTADRFSFFKVVQKAIMTREDKNSGRLASPAPGDVTGPRGDELQLPTIHPRVTQVKAAREEIMLLFGAGGTRDPAKDELRIPLLRRIVLNPSSAKRLALQLDRVMNEYESTFGVLKQGVVPPARLKPTPPLQPPAFKTPQAVEKVELLFELLQNLKIAPAFERSFKVKENLLLENRFLLGLEKDFIGPNPNEKILSICEQIGMPSDLLATFIKNLPEASIVGFGFGENESTCIVRAYLEFGIRYYRAMQNKPRQPDPYLSHLGCKWDIADNTRSVVTEYTCYPAYTTENMLERLASSFYRPEARNPYEIVKALLDLAASKVGNDKFLFLGVTEEGHPRNSFDINLYGASLQLKEVHPLLVEICRHYSIPEAQFRELYEPISTHKLGHIAGAVDRHGRDFLTVYYGE